MPQIAALPVLLRSSMHPSRRFIFGGQIETKIQRRLDDLEADVLEAQQVQAGEFSGDGTQRVLLRRIVYIQSAAAEHGDLEGDLLHVRTRHTVKALQGTEAIRHRIRPEGLEPISRLPSSGMKADRS